MRRSERDDAASGEHSLASADGSDHESLDGPSAPALFLDHVSAAEATAIAERLSSPGLADANRGYFVVPVAIRCDGSGDLVGTLGGVPAS